MEAGNKIQYFDSLNEAEFQVKEWETEDKKDGTYVVDFYEIIKQDEK
jgi:hypothetical protein